MTSNAEIKRVLVLLSGGIDSSACVHYYVSKGYAVSALFLKYGQPDAQLELRAAKKISAHYGITLRIRTLSEFKWEPGYVPARNALLLTIALMEFIHDIGMVSIGIHSGTPYVDCSVQFVELMQQLFDVYQSGRIRIDAPFVNWTKSNIYDYAASEKMPLHLTHSNNAADLGTILDDPNTSANEGQY